MVISAIFNKTTESVYINLHAEQSFTGSFLIFNDDIENNIIEGVYQSLLKEDTVKRINDFFDSEKKTKLLVLDFNYIDDIQLNKPDLFVSLKEKTELLTFININKEIIDKVGVSFFNSPSNITNGNIYEQFFLTEKECNEIQILGTDELFENVFLQKLIECKETQDSGKKKHHSSSVYLPVFLDLKKMMINERPFFIYVVYMLAMKMRIKWEIDDLDEQENNKPILFCQNLNSSYIASILSSFLKLDLLSMDHIGPINKVYSNLKNRIQEGLNYIVISDLVCLGTEVKICKNVINYSGGKYIGNASIVRVETLHPEDDYSNYEYIFKITKENNSEIGYVIETALMQ